jgi:hypothetical protein
MTIELSSIHRFNTNSNGLWYMSMWIFNREYKLYRRKSKDKCNVCIPRKYMHTVHDIDDCVGFHL